MNLYKIAAIIILSFILLFSWTTALGEEIQNIKIPILLYHNISDTEIYDINTVHIGPVEFEQQIKILKEEGYNTIFFSEYYEYVINGKELPPKPIIITFDDGYTSNYKYAYPILKKYNMKATIFVITGRVGDFVNVKYPHFNWEQAKEMLDSGVIDIQSHSDFHKNMTKISKSELQLELRRSKYLIEKRLKKRCTVFAYPYGISNLKVKQIAKKAGYLMQVIVGDKGVNTKDNDMLNIKRLTVRGGIGPKGVIKLIEDNMIDERKYDGDINSNSSIQ